MKTSVIIFLAATIAITAGRPWPRDDPEGLKPTKACEKQANLTTETGINEAAFSSSFHFSVAFAGSLLLLFGWMYVSRSGYVLSRRKYYSTDDHMWFWMGLISIPWTVLVPISTQSWDRCEGKYEIERSTWWQGPRFWGRMAFWFTKRHGWAACICFVLAVGPTAWAAGGALHSRLYLLGTLTVGGLAMFLVVLLTCYKYTNFDTELPHTYAMDDITNDNHADPLGPAIGYSLKCEQRLLWDHRSFLEPVYRDTDWDLGGKTTNDISDKCEKPLRNCSKSVQELITSLISNIPDDGSMIQALGVWLYDSDEAKAAHSTPTIRSTPESRLAFLPNSTTEKYTLIGRDIALALLLWDELIFDRRWQLECGKEHSSVVCADCNDFREKAWGWRERTGTFVKGVTNVRGSQSGLDGLKRAAGQVYRLIPLEMADKSVPKDYDKTAAAAVDNALAKSKDLKETAGYLWDVCWKVCPSTFGALYLWTTAWYMYHGNETFHTTPLLPEKDLELWLDYIPSYLTAWRIRWRFLWYGSVACQLVILLPTAFAGLIGLVGI
ncbi:uncharacterized protein F5Z01DRAFT_732244 [Emericellopsis atlantica]|uniref:Uncharacterized protein n=1 Tax=Emericellopsis atlantica TaxID=2614577 RepID=A0A9P7ZCD3_9HYPO|nr:uncharacterized protein F5Z01DRAFT_732244 [Emericellopsis atlantica]KAG9249484.1 hypothetical protein F5Z01DRAFT_732244 [Emericellopsis atlantica]